MNEGRVDQVCKAVLADSCAVQNLLSSSTLQAACTSAGLQFAMTKYCLYECLDKPRKIELQGDLEIRRRLRAARAQGLFPDHELTVEDLQEAAILRLRRRLGAGELSAIALAKRFRIGFQTDDDRAEKLAVDVLARDRVQTTPHVLGWLLFHGHVGDDHVTTIIQEHTAAGRNIATRFRGMQSEAMRIRAMTETAGAGGEEE